MDKSKEVQMKRVFKRMIKKVHEELNREMWTPQVKDIIVDACVGQMMKEVTVRTYIK